MTEDDILAKLGRHVREEQRDDAALEKIASGQEVPGEIAERAKTDDDLAKQIEASRPLGAAAVERIAANVARPKVVRLARRGTPSAQAFRRAAARFAAPLALAAGVFLFFALRGPDGAALPGYSVTASGEQATRGEPVQTLRASASPASRFEIVARPEVATTGKIVAYAFVMQGGEPSPLDAKIDVADAGSVRITGVAKALRGSDEVRVVVAEAATIARYDDALALARTKSSDARVRVLSLPIER